MFQQPSADRMSEGVPDAGGEPSLEALMEAYQRGERAAFESLFARLAPKVHVLLLRLSRSRDLADELTQVTFLKLHRARETYAPGSRVLPWVMAIARNVFIDAYRKSRVLRRHEVLTTEGVLPEPPRANRDEPAGLAVLTDEEQQRVQETIDQLPAIQREALVLLKVEGLSLKEVSAITGASVGAVKVRAFRAYEALRGALGVARRKPPDAPSPRTAARRTETP